MYKKLIVLVLAIVVFGAATYINQTNKVERQITARPIVNEQKTLANEPVKLSSCVDYSCNTAEDCKLGPDLFTTSECSKPTAFNKATTDECLKKMSAFTIQASCILPENYQRPNYKVACENNKCVRLEE